MWLLNLRWGLSLLAVSLVLQGKEFQNSRLCRLTSPTIAPPATAPLCFDHPGVAFITHPALTFLLQWLLCLCRRRAQSTITTDIIVGPSSFNGSFASVNGKLKVQAHRRQPSAPPFSDHRGSFNPTSKLVLRSPGFL
ncbi:hypothetical protein U1Q18_010876 [Sarracenia purpurea var. burkii]